MSRGNRNLLGACCGGFSLWSEEFIWMMMEQSFPRHHVQSIIPFSTTQTETWNGVFGSGQQVLFGWFSSDPANEVVLDLKMFDSSGIIKEVFQTINPAYQSNFNPLMAVQVDGNSEESHWQFSGWLIQLQGPAYESGGIQVDFQETLAGSYPVAAQLAESHNLTILSPYYSFAGQVVTLPPGVDSVTAYIDFNRLQIGTTGVYEDYTAEEITAMLRCPEGRVTVGSVNNLNSTTARVTFTISNLFNPSTACTWLEDIAVLVQTNSVGDTIDSQEDLGIQFFDLDTDQVVDVVQNRTVTGIDEDQTACKGLTCCKNRKIDVRGTNGNAFPQDVSVTSFGGFMNFNMTAVPGSFQAVNDTDFLRADLAEILFRQPVFTVALGTPV